MDRERMLEWADALDGVAAEMRMSAEADLAVEVASISYGIIEEPEACLPRAYYYIDKASDLVAWRRTIENQFVRGGGGPIQINWDNGRSIICNTMTEVDNEFSG